MMMRPLILLLLCLPSAALAASLDEVVDGMLHHHPALAASTLRSQAAASTAETSGLWADPMLSLEVSNLPVTSFALGGHGMSGVQLKAQQQLHLPGWSRQQQAVSTLNVRTSELATAELQVALRHQVETAWWELTRARLQRTITATHIARANELLAAIRARYETGRAGQHSVLRLEVLRDRLTDDLHDFAAREATWTAQLDALTAEAQHTYHTPAEPQAAPAPSQLSATSALTSHRPTQHKLHTEAERLDASASLARIDARPEPTVWAGYRVRTINTDMDAGTDLLSMGVAMPIPTSSRRRGQSAEAHQLALASATRAGAQADLDRSSAELSAVLSRWTRAQTKAETYSTSLIPAAQAALDTTFSEFSVDKADFSSLFDAEVVLLDLERARLDAVINTHISASTARALTGDPTLGARP